MTTMISEAVTMPAPLISYTTSSLFSGTARHPIFADRLLPFERRHDLPVVMIHGACNTGTCFLTTPDGRPGWAHDFATAGIETYVVDWPGHGRSPMRADFLSLSGKDVCDAVAVLLDRIGPAILLAHSAGGPIIWSLAEQYGDLVGGLVGVAPGPPANLVPQLEEGSPQGVQDDSGAGFPILAPADAPFMVDEAFVRDYWFSGPAAPDNAAPDFFRSVVPESPRIINERFNVAGEGLRLADAALVGARPTLIVGPECDPRHPKPLDAATAQLFGAEFAWLPDHGIHGNGHMLMGDRNSSTIAALMIRWILDTVPGARA